MNHRTDKILLAVFLLSLALYAAGIPFYINGLPLDWPDWLFTACAWLAVSFHALPVFCLQLLLCRRTWRWMAALLPLVVIGAALWSVHGFFTATGWDTLGWGILMVLSIAPAVGCALGWAAYGLWRLYRRGDIHEVQNSR